MNDAAALPVEPSSSRPSKGKLFRYTFEEPHVGMSEIYGKTITKAGIILFAEIPIDNNPANLKHEFAAETIFEGRIAQGMLTASFFPTVIVTNLPGPGCIYVSRNLRFKAPVGVSDTVTAVVTITNLNNAKLIVSLKTVYFVSLKTVYFVGDRGVIDGDAAILVPQYN
jgi:3-hydroxybutyryl-CoA dehydratase